MGMHEPNDLEKTYKSLYIRRENLIKYINQTQDTQLRFKAVQRLNEVEEEIHKLEFSNILKNPANDNQNKIKAKENTNTATNDVKNTSNLSYSIIQELKDEK